MRILKGVRHLRSLEISLQERARSAYFLEIVELIRSDLVFSTFSYFLSFFSMRLSFFETCL